MSVDDLLMPGTAQQPPDLGRRFRERAAGAVLADTARKAGPAAIDVAGEARELVAGLLADPWGQVSPSAYETGRLVSLAPWLTGHAERVEFLLAAQRPDGTWGGPGGYALVPTLGATEALIAELRRHGPRPGRHEVAGAARRGLDALRGRPDGSGIPGFPGLSASGPRDLPDMPAIELIVPALTAMINGHLEAMGEWEPLTLPAGMDGAKLSAIRARLTSGAAVPQKVLHALETVGEAAAGAPGVVPTPIPDLAETGAGETAGAVGASPAAGAAWLGAGGAGDTGSPVRRYLEAVAGRYGGPVPCATPVAAFERGWALSWLRRAGVPVAVPEELVTGLDAAIGPGGSAAGPGLPPDADTTSVALYALALLRVPREPDSLWEYETETHFCTWQGEEGASPTVNAHVLDAFGEYARLAAGASGVVRSRGVPSGAEPSPAVRSGAVTSEAAPSGAVSRYTAAVGKLSAWLRGRQRADGSWSDRWHASPYYATACCALALEDYGGEESADAVRAAVRWLLDTQREDGSWGHRAGTAEETAYALQTLLLTAPAGRPEPVRPAAGASGRADAAGDRRRETAVARGYRSLLASVTGHGEPVEAPALWHDKDLYFPAAIVRAAILGALHLARRALSQPAPHALSRIPSRGMYRTPFRVPSATSATAPLSPPVTQPSSTAPAAMSPVSSSVSTSPSSASSSMAGRRISDNGR
ncbi:prenyltransferase/squalene oxidase repeat-containing protein [Streptosporangium sp. NPDC051022]|uniref:prenyltransferase/squalene oxidase repeat-containing protein n=1 Tax=Streptosporangium sp. NPDC051022 TaxID=3155752 RepID=UPI003433BE56